MFRILVIVLVAVALVSAGYEYPVPSKPLVLLKDASHSSILAKTVLGDERKDTGFGFNVGGIVGQFGSSEEHSHGGHNHGSGESYGHNHGSQNLFIPAYSTGHDHHHYYNQYPDHHDHYDSHGHGHYDSHGHYSNYNGHYDCCHHHHYDGHHK